MDALGPGDPREVGPYRLAGVLGAGGMGRVYLGHSRSGRQVAIKLVNADLAQNPDFRARFAREIAAARAVSGVFTAAVVDADPHAGQPWLATAYVDAPTLQQYVAAHGPLPEASLRFLAAGLAEALDAIHRAGVVHRDLKPSNVLLAADGPRVIDFGIARALDGTAAGIAAAGGSEGRTSANMLLGSPGFMAPEQLTAGSPIGPPCDVFCLGLVLCFAAGVEPYGEGPAQALLYRIVHEGPDLSGIPEGPRAVIAACLAKDPGARPTSAQVLDLTGTSDAMVPTPTVKMPRTPGARGHRTALDPANAPQAAVPAPVGQPAGPGLDGTAGHQAPPTQSARIPLWAPPRPPAQGPHPADGQSWSAPPTPSRPADPWAVLPTAATSSPPVPKRRVATLVGIPAAVAALAGVVAIVVLLTQSGGTTTSGGVTGGPTPPTTPATSPSTGAAALVDTLNSGTPIQGGTVTYLMARKSSNYNPWDLGSVPEGLPFMSAIQPAPFIVQPDGTTTLNKDLMSDATMTKTTPQTLVYTIKPAATWNDGTPITAGDFTYTWLAQAGKDPAIPAASSAGYEDIASITGSPDGRTVTVTFSPGRYFGDWRSLFALFPQHIAAQHGYNDALTSPPAGDAGLEASWKAFGAAAPAWSGGPFEVDPANPPASGAEPHVTLIRNPRWYGPAGTPHLDRIDFRYVADRDEGIRQLQTLGNAVFVDGDVLNADVIRQADHLDGAKYGHQLTHSLAWDHLDFNMQSPTLGGVRPADQAAGAKLALRKALLTVVDRDGIIKGLLDTADPGAVPPNSRVLLPGEPGYADDITSFGLGTGNLNAAEKILTDAGYTGVGTKLTAPDGRPVPTLILRTIANNQKRLIENQAIQADMSKLGVTVQLQETDSLTDSLNHVSGKDYDLITYGWTPSAFPVSGTVPIWATKTSANQSTSLNYAGFSDPAVDGDLTKAAQATDPAQAAADLNAADQRISADAASLPLFQWESLVVYTRNFVNVRDDATGPTPAYNTQDWGLAGS